MTFGGVTLNPPERIERLSGERVAEISLAACSMPADVPVTGWLNDLCADLFDARALIAARDAEIARLRHAARVLRDAMRSELVRRDHPNPDHNYAMNQTAWLDEVTP